MSVAYPVIKFGCAVLNSNPIFLAAPLVLVVEPMRNTSVSNI